MKEISPGSEFELLKRTVGMFSSFQSMCA